VKGNRRIRSVSGFEPADGPEVGEELSAGNKFEDEVEVPRILAESFKVDNEGVLQIAEDSILVDDVVYLFETNDFSFLQTF
jgi:hypothetical protein